MKYNKNILNRFLTEKVAIAVRTEQEWQDFMELLESETDVAWRENGMHMMPTLLNLWKKYGSYSCITFNFANYARLEFCDGIFYILRGYKVIEYRKLIKEEQK